MHIWTFRDAAGVERQGTFVRATNILGTDVAYHILELETERLFIVSGQRLQEATLTYKTPEVGIDV